MSAPASLSEPVFPPLAINPELVRKILVRFIQNEVQKVGFERGVLGLSGGVDSSLVATLASEALGPANVQKAPSADLWAGQSDETELGFAYRMVDQFLYYLVDRRYSKEELSRLGFEPAFIDDIIRRVRDNQYKRRLPVIAKLSSRTVDQEFRYPRDWGH